MTDSHFSDFRDRSSNRNRSPIRNRSSTRKPTNQSDRSSFHSRSSSQLFDQSSSQFHNKFSNRQSQRVEFGIKFLKFFQNVKNRFFIIEKNLEYINDCLEQYIEKRIEDHAL